MTHEGHLDLLEVSWGVLVDREDSEDADTNDHDDEPEVDEVHLDVHNRGPHLHRYLSPRGISYFTQHKR